MIYHNIFDMYNIRVSFITLDIFDVSQFMFLSFTIQISDYINGNTYHSGTSKRYFNVDSSRV